MIDPELITDWRVDADVDDEPVLVGRRAGAPWRSLPLARIDLDAHTARVVDGTVHRLGPPAVPIDPADPLALPPPARQRRLGRLRAALDRLSQGRGPTEAELAAAPRLDGWTLRMLRAWPVLFGIVTGHPRLPDGVWIHTSPVVWIAADRAAGRTVSRWYVLGTSLEDEIRSGDH